MAAVQFFSRNTAHATYTISPSIESIYYYDPYPMERAQIKRVVCPTWMVTFFFTPMIETRVGTSKHPWRKRQAMEAGVYPPSTVAYEKQDPSQKGGSGMGMYLIDGEKAGLSKLIKPGQHYASILDLTGQLRQLFQKMLRSVMSNLPQQNFHALQAMMWRMFELLLSAQHTHEEYHELLEAAPEEKSLGQKVEEYLQENYTQKITLESLADHFHMSKTTLRRSFLKEQNRPIIRRLNEIRIEAVQIMLMQGINLCNMKDYAGFSDEFHLSRMFKKITGMSPREYVRSRHGVL